MNTLVLSSGEWRTFFKSFKITFMAFIAIIALLVTYQLCSLNYEIRHGIRSSQEYHIRVRPIEDNAEDELEMIKNMSADQIGYRELKILSDIRDIITEEETMPIEEQSFEDTDLDNSTEEIILETEGTKMDSQAGVDTEATIAVPTAYRVTVPVASREEIEEWKDTTVWTRQYLHGFNDSLAIQSMHYLIEIQNFSISGAAGIVGNIYTECRFDPEADCGGTHIGIMQWDWLERWPKITKWLSQNGYDKYDYVGQLLATFYSEDANNYQNVFERMRTMDNPVIAADYWQIMYEGAEGQGTGQRELGARLAEALYQLAIHDCLN